MRVRPTREIERALGLSSEIFLSGRQRVPGLTIVTGSLKESIWRISLPLLLISIFTATVDLVHVQCAGLIGTKDQAIIGVCDQIMLMAIMALASLATAITASISRLAPNADDKALAGGFADALKISLLLAVVLTALVFFGGPLMLVPFSGCVETCNATLIEGANYLKIASLSLIPISLFSVVNAFFLGLGRSSPQLITIAVMALIDGVLSYVLVTYQIFDSLAIGAIALSTLTGSLLACLVAFCLLARSPKHISWSALISPKFGTGWDMLKRSIPATLQDNGWAASAFVLYLVAGALSQSTDVVAALNTGQRIEALVQAPLAALASAALVVTGQNIGVNRPRRAWRASVIATVCGTALMLVAGIILFVFANQIAALGNNAETTQPYVAQYLRIAAFGLSFVGLETILTGSLQACDDTKFPLLIGFICSWAISIPAAYLLAVMLHMQSMGVWIALLVANFIAGISLLARFSIRPEWKLADSAVGTAGDVASDYGAVPEPQDKSPSGSQRPCLEISMPPETDVTASEKANEDSSNAKERES